ncbi:MAG: VanZ family protein [Planctomycetes bacterium]|nr:VanZ family protein [Planctomycetota bacterium]
MGTFRILRPLPWAVAALAAYWLLLFVVTHTPHVPQVNAPRMTDKVVHFAGYAGLTFLAAVVILRRSRWSRGAVMGILLAAMLYGVADELMQIPIPNRSANVWDWVSDCLGAAAGLAIFRVGQKSLQYCDAWGCERRGRAAAWGRES